MMTKQNIVELYYCMTDKDVSRWAKSAISVSFLSVAIWNNTIPDSFSSLVATISDKYPRLAEVFSRQNKNN